MKLYATRFTEQELKEMLAFYKSPLGKKLIAEEPAFVDRTMSAAQDWAIKLNEEVAAAFPRRNEEARPRALIAERAVASR